MRRLLGQLRQFASVGVLATGVHVVAALGLNSFLGYATLVANFMAFLLATAFSYFGNWAWTFDARARHGQAAPRFFAVCLAGFALNQAIVLVVTTSWAKPMWLAMVFVMLTVPPLSFWLSRSFAFAPRKPA